MKCLTGVPGMVFLCDTGLAVCFSLQVCHTSQLTLSLPLLDCFLQSTFCNKKNTEKIEHRIVHKKQ
jgi:hypothetical protein